MPGVWRGSVDEPRGKVVGARRGRQADRGWRRPVPGRKLEEAGRSEEGVTLRAAQQREQTRLLRGFRAAGACGFQPGVTTERNRL